MKNLILSLCLILIGSPASAGGGLLKVKQHFDINELTKCIRLFPVKKDSFFTQRKTFGYKTHKQSLKKATQGYKPETQVPVQWHYEQMPLTVKFLDDSGERFIDLSNKRDLTKLALPKVKKINDHTILVTLDKIEE